MESLKYANTRARHALPFYALRAATPETALPAVSGVAARRVSDLQLSSTPSDTTRLTPMNDDQEVT
jgi:hypothetical protein